MKARWNFWYDVDGCDETVLALTPLKDTAHAERRKKEILQSLKLSRALEGWVKFFKKNPKKIWRGKDFGDLLSHELGKPNDFTNGLGKEDNHVFL
ncbi:hypothetical protein LCGC14_2980250 [marine sediment metagenome]|uniref:Uncharacterized protein n=1 Tax=marine sediment metagenome TaxID=412755 RepID=A0A0F8ZEB9_9ZZZZ|nr:hypothetical protein [bacterium]